MRSIRDRVAALEALLLADQQQTPYAEMDPISQALVDVIKELDTPEKKAAYCELYNMQAAELENFIYALTW